MTAQQTQGRPENEAGQPPDLSASNPAVRAVERAVDRFETARSYMERDNERNRQDVRELRDQARQDMLNVNGRLERLETKIADLPTKIWIGTVVLSAIAVVSGIVTIIAKAAGH